MPRLVHVTAIGMSAVKLLLPQAQAARDAGYEVAFAYSPDPASTQFLQKEGFLVFEVPISRSIHLAHDLRSARQLATVLSRWHPDIVHTHTSKGGAVGRMAARMLAAKVVHTIHGFPFVPGQDIRRYWAYVAAEWIMARTMTDMLLSQSREDVALAKRYGIRARLGFPRWIGNGVDVTKFNPAKVKSGRYFAREFHVSDNEMVILTIARITREKGLAEAAEALALASHLPWRWFIVGEVEDRRFDLELRRRVAALGITQRVHFLGHRDDIRDLLSEADWFLLTSHREGVPRSMIEAHAMGVPVITTDVRGCREVTVHGETGFVVRLGSVESLAETICQAFALPAERYQAMRAKARERAVQEFAEQTVIKRILDSYADVLSR